MKSHLIIIFSLFVLSFSLKDITQETINETKEEVEDNFNDFQKKMKK